MEETRAQRVSATVFFKQKYTTNPSATPADTIVAALDNVTTALQGRMPILLHEFYLQAIQHLHKILGQAKATQDAKNTKVIKSKT